MSTTAYHAGYENDKRNESHANHDDLESGRTIRKRYSPEPVRAPLKKLILSLSERDQVVVFNTGSVCVCRKKTQTCGVGTQTDVASERRSVKTTTRFIELGE